jgi:sugar/nucleoside kinase (ribokinase family)
MTTYLLIGHLAHDKTPDGPKLGGTVSYGGATAAACGATTYVFTSAAPDEVLLPELYQAVQGVHLIPAKESTIFVNVYTGNTRVQQTLGHAALIDPQAMAALPDPWRAADIIHLAPLCDEISPEVADMFPGSFLAATPQGWMRSWDMAGRVYAKPWQHAERLLPRLDVVVFSEEDIGRDAALEAHYAKLAKLLVVTRAADGCTIYQQGKEALQISAPMVKVADATGAGDVFTAAFLVALKRTGQVEKSARVAVQIASESVTRIGLAGTPAAGRMDALLEGDH